MCLTFSRTFDWSVSTSPAGKKDQRAIQIVQEAVKDRGPADDFLAILKLSANTIGYVFNHSLGAPKAFPLLVCGDVRNPATTENSLLLFLLFHLLDIPEDAIECVWQAIYSFYHDAQKVIAGDQKEKQAEPGAFQTRWTRQLRPRIDTQYGSIAGYLGAAGVTEAAKKNIRDALLPAVCEESCQSLISLEVSDKEALVEQR